MTGRDDDADGCRASPGNATGCRLPVDPGLSEQGWEWRCNADGAKLGSVVETYRELGFEVRLEALDLRTLSEDCEGCKGTLAQASAVFVRRKGAGPSPAPGSPGTGQSATAERPAAQPIRFIRPS